MTTFFLGCRIGSVRRPAAVLAALLLAIAGDSSAQSVIDSAVKVTNVESSYPFWSPDGRRMVFQSDRNGDSDIYVANADGTGLTRIVANPADDLTPAWSPDGRSIVFQSNRDGNEEIYIVNADGTGLRNLTTHPANDGHPKWAPDGRTIIFNSNRDGEANDEIYEIGVDGTGLRRLTTYERWDTYPPISPDGGRIVFRRVTAAPGIDAALRLSERNSEIFVMSRDGSRPVNLTNSAAFDGWPAWSPDGRRIAFSSNRTGRFQIYSMNADGTDVRQLVDRPGDFTKPIYSEDGRIVCTRTLDGNVEIFVLHLGRNAA